MQKMLLFFNLLDRHNNASLTNIAFIATLLNSLFNNSSYFTSTLLFILAAINYMHRRKEVNAIPKESGLQTEIDDLKSRLDDVSKQITALSMKSGISNFNGQ